MLTQWDAYVNSILHCVVFSLRALLKENIIKEMPTTTMGCKDAKSEKSIYHDFGDDMVIAVLQKE